jgi:hypothetical protein
MRRYALHEGGCPSLLRLRARRVVEVPVEQMAIQEFSWLHVMNVSLGIATLLVMAFMIGAVARELGHQARSHRH